jgi:hypothetical protein
VELFYGVGVSSSFTWLSVGSGLTVAVAVLAWATGAGKALPLSAGLTVALSILIAAAALVASQGLGLMLHAWMGDDPLGFGYQSIEGSFASYDGDEFPRRENAAAGAALFGVGFVAFVLVLTVRNAVAARGELVESAEAAVEGVVLVAGGLLLLSLLATAAANFAVAATQDEFHMERRPIPFAISTALLWLGYLASALRRYEIGWPWQRDAPEEQ